MAVSYKVEINITRNGQPVFGSPIVRRLQVDEDIQEEFTMTSAASSLPLADQLTTKQLLILTSDKTSNVRFNTGSAGDLPLAAGGLLIAVDLNDTVVEVDNTDAADDANIRFIIGGT